MISIIVPAFNEAQRLPSLFPTFASHRACSGEPIELIFVDDGSTDDTVDVLERCQQQYHLEDMRILLNERNRGKGHAVRQGMLAGRGECLFTDADLSTPLTELAKLRSRIGEADIAIGSRAVPGAELLEEQSLYRRLGGKAINLFVQALALPGIRDSQCGFKLFTQEATQEIFSRTTLDGFSFDIEVLYIARKLGFRIAEVPVVWKNAPGSKVHPIKDGLRLLRDLLIIRANDRRGLYHRPPK